MKPSARRIRPVSPLGGSRPAAALAQPAGRASAAGPAGTTLTEVLISLMVMGIGVVSLASLFPISVLRSIQATQLTNATFLAKNASAMIESDQTILQGIRAVNGDTLGIIDPLGYYLMPAALQTKFGNSDSSTPHTITRYSAGRVDEAGADFLVTLPDSWVDVGEGAAASTPDASSVTVPVTAVDLANLNLSLTRVVLFDLEGRSSQIRSITSAPTSNGTNWTISWSDPLPSGFGDVGMVRFQTQERRYTWMLTVRKSDVGTPVTSKTYDIDAVIFFRRPFAVADEQIYTANFIKGSNSVVLKHSAGKPPYLKKGGYVFDATNNVNNGQWYKIQNVNSPAGGSQTTLTLERPAVANGTLALCMRGVVEVYSLGTKSTAP